MLTRRALLISFRIGHLILFLAFLIIVFPGKNVALAQSSEADFHKILREQGRFDQVDFAALEQGETVVKLLPAGDKKEVAVCGIVRLQIPAEEFLQSFRENMSRKNNAAILEIGRFSNSPTLDELQNLTIENRDIDDMKDCVVGDCQLKLSAQMIERFHREIDWAAPDYAIRAAQLLKRMLLDYVLDYLARGDMALIEYNDKQKEVRVSDEQRSLNTSTNVNAVVSGWFPQYLKGSASPDLRVVDSAIVWSKIKFGLKPVIAINHITIYKREHGAGSQILITSKQIYANHYFDSSLALTAFVSSPASPGSYLFYENRSLTDGLGGVFGKIKRDVVERKAVASLKAILEDSKLKLNARILRQAETAPAPEGQRSWRRWRLGSVHLAVLLILISAFVALFAVTNSVWRRGIGEEAHR